MKNSNSNSKPSTSSSLGESLRSTFVIVAMVVNVAIAFVFYFKVLGDPVHFVGGLHENGPAEGDYFGIVYMGGIIVPILISLLLIVITFSIERIFTLMKASGKGSTTTFIKKIRAYISANEIEKAIAECDRQKGSVANVVKAGLLKYKEMETAQYLDNEKKVLAIQKDIEETTQLEMPMLERNLVIISTIASVATLVGLLGTVIGMINAFAALANAGAPDAVKLASGISEALINTALGIGTSALAIIGYNFFTSKIDGLTYGIDEAGFSIIQNFASRNVDKVVI